MNRMMGKKNGKRADGRQKKPPGKSGQLKTAGGKQHWHGRRDSAPARRSRPPPAEDDDMENRRQRIHQLKQSLGLSAGARQDGGRGITAGVDDYDMDGMDTEGLDHLVTAAQLGQLSLVEDGDISAGMEEKSEQDSKRKRKHTDEENDSSDDDVEKSYEQTPRAFPVVRDLLPIKTKGGVVKRKVLVQKKEEAPDQAEEAGAEAAPAAAEPSALAEPAVKSVAAIYAERRAKIDAAKLRIGLLSRGLLEEPQEKYDNLYRLLDFLSESDPAVRVTVRKYAAVSLLEVFKDLLPSYKLQEHDMTEKLKKETIAVYKYENALIGCYKKFLIKLEEYTKALSSDKAPMKSLALLCLDCMCQCLVRFRDFNFASNLVGALVPLTGHREGAARAAVSAAVRTVFAEDRSAERSLEIVRKVCQLIKAKQYDCRRDITDLFLALRIRSANLDKEREDEIKAKKFMTYKEKLKNMSRKERKRSKKLEALERELMATKAEESKQDKTKRHTEILTAVFTVYFKILKQMPRSALMASVLEGLAKFAHMINVDFFHDLVEGFHGLLASRCLHSTREVLLCVQTVFTMLSGQGEAINIDPQRFYGHCYRTLNELSLDDCSDELHIALASLDVMLIRRRKKISPQRVLSFTKRLASLALRAPHPAAAAILMMIRNITMVHPSTGRLLDTETVASGLYRPEVDDPEYCGAGNTLLYELTALRRSYHQPVRTLAAHVMLSCPVQGDFALPPYLRQQSATDILEMCSTKENRFVPAVTPPSIVKKRPKKVKSHHACDSDWVTSQLASLRAGLSVDKIDFAKHLTRR